MPLSIGCNNPNAVQFTVNDFLPFEELILYITIETITNSIRKSRQARAEQNLLNTIIAVLEQDTDNNPTVDIADSGQTKEAVNNLAEQSLYNSNLEQFMQSRAIYM